MIAALVIGAMGSLHCMGMCGPIALMLHARVPGAPYLHSFLYNSGRLITYGLMGAVVASIGQGLALAGMQQALTIATGCIILFFVIVPYITGKSSFGNKWNDRIGKEVRKVMQKVLPESSPGGFLLAGMVNGLLPCGLVYVALAGALNTGQYLNGALFMVLFGAGTFPAMFIAGIAGKYLTLQRRLGIRRVLPWFTAAVAILLIVRGLDLGIPYLSPHTTVQGEVMDCCATQGTH